MKIQIKTITGELFFEHEMDGNSIKETVKALLKKFKDTRISVTSIDFSGSRFNNSRFDNNSEIKKSCTTFKSKRYIQVTSIGSAKRMTTYCFEDDTVWCGCFTGTLKQFEKQVKETHKEPQYLKEYLGFITYIKSLS